MASTIASSLQQLSMSFGLACGSLITGWYLAGLKPIISSLTFWTLRKDDGESISKGVVARAEVEKI